MVVGSCYEIYDKSFTNQNKKPQMILLHFCLHNPIRLLTGSELAALDVAVIALPLNVVKVNGKNCTLIVKQRFMNKTD